MGKKAKARKAARDEHDVVPASASGQDTVETATRLHSAAIHLLRRLSHEDQSLGLSAARLSALSVLVFGGPRTLGQLAAAEGVTPPTMTRLAAAMEAEGLVSRSTRKGDRRVVLITATDEGERILRQGREQRVQTLAEALGTATPEELAAVARATDVVERVLAGQPPR